MLLLLSFSLNTRFGVVAVPTILLFHSGKPVLKFNNSISLDDVRNFIKNNTGMSSCDSENKLSVKCLYAAFENKKFSREFIRIKH